MIPGKNFRHMLLPALLLAALLASCASKPAAPQPEPAPAEPPAVAEPAPEQPAAVPQADLDALLAQAKELKKKAFDLKLFEVLPDDYKTADGSYTTAVASYDAASRDAKEAPAAKEGLEKTISLFKELIEKGVVEVAKAKRDNADSMKAAALKAGADTKAADRLAAADEAYAAAAALVDEGKHEEAIGAFERARLYYELAYKRSVASDLRDRIAAEDFAKWDSGNNQLAENKYSAEEGLWATGAEADRASGVDLLDESILRFNLVVQKGRQSVALGAKEKTDDSKAKSEEIKAQVAVKDQYAAAVATYEEAVTKYSAGDYEEATSGFEEALAAFDAAYDAAAEKREKAQAAMESAAAATEDSARKAEEAEALVEAGSAP